MKAFDIICPSEWVRVDPARPDGPRIAEIAHEYGLRAYPEFREQVNRYIHDYEAMLRNVMATREGTPLSVALLSADTGKLYVALAQAIERLRS